MKRPRSWPYMSAVQATTWCPFNPSKAFDSTMAPVVEPTVPEPVVNTGSETATAGSEVAGSESGGGVAETVDEKAEAVKLEVDALTNAMNVETKGQAVSENSSEEQEEDETLITDDEEKSKEIEAVVAALSDDSIIEENTTNVAGDEATSAEDEATSEEDEATPAEDEATEDVAMEEPQTSAEDEATTTVDEATSLLELKSGLRGGVSHKAKEVLCDTPFQCKQKVATNSMQKAK